MLYIIAKDSSKNNFFLFYIDDNRLASNVVCYTVTELIDYFGGIIIEHKITYYKRGVDE